jgi:AraC-like DNA-binding protein
LTPPPSSEAAVPDLFQVPFIRWANYAPYRVGGVLPPRQLYDHEFIYIISGKAHIVIDGTAHPAPADSLFLIQPRQWHSFRVDGGEPWVPLGVHFDWAPRSDTSRFTRFFAAVPPLDESLFREPRQVPRWDLHTVPVLHLGGRPRVRRLLEEVVSEYGRGDAEARQGAGALLAAAIIQMQREARLLKEITTHAVVGADAVRRVQRARELLESPRETPLSIEDAAEAVGWSGDHLRRMFRAVLGTSPNQVQTAARLRRARELLRYGGLPIGEIARRCGFEDASHFTRVFKKETGQTPREWVASNRQGS